MICPYCQRQIPSDSLVCGYCGHKIEETLQKAEAPAEAAASSTEEAVPAAAEEKEPLENERAMLSGNGDLAATDEKEASPEESSEVSGGSDSETVKGISPEAASKKALEPSLSQAGMPENGKESEGPTASSAFISPAAVASESSADVTSTEKNSTEAASGDTQAAVTAAGSTHSNHASSNEPNSTAEAEPAPQARGGGLLQQKEAESGKEAGGGVYPPDGKTPKASEDLQLFLDRVSASDSRNQPSASIRMGVPQKRQCQPQSVRPLHSDLDFDSHSLPADCFDCNDSFGNFRR